MASEIKVNWCPGCKGWKPSTAVARDLRTARLHQDHNQDFLFFRKTHVCNACGEGFVTVKLADCEPDDRWRANARLAELRAGDVDTEDRWCPII